MTRLRTILTLCLSTVAIVAPGCSGDAVDAPSDETEPQATTDDALISSVDCHIKTDTAYVSGSAKPIKLITVGGKPTSIAVGHQFLKMQKAANAAGVTLAINSGFRTMAEQKHLYQCYQTKSCNNGNLAARPGYSNHQGGFALDLTTSSWLAKNAAKFGFKRTVPSEAWQNNAIPASTSTPTSGAPQNDGSSQDDGTPQSDATPTPTPPPTPDATCHSDVLGSDVALGTCVQRPSDDAWFVCDGPAPDWTQVAGPSDASCTACPQLAAGACQ
jgi:D-alanyl-D-alanine dipeptidase